MTEFIAEQSTFGTSKLPPQIIHHTVWWYKFYRKYSLLDHIYCSECNTSYPSSKMLYDDHPKPEYMIAKTKRHVPPKRK